MGNIFDLANDVLRAARASQRQRQKFENTLNDPQKKATVVGYGVSGIILPFVTVILVALCYFGVQALVEAVSHENTSIFLYWVPIIILVLAAPIIGLTLSIGGLRNSIWQTKLDKKVTGIIGIILNILVLLASIVGTVIILGSLSMK